MAIDFYRRVEIVGRRIPYGRVVTYGQIALLCGRPNNARQVGYSLRRRMMDGQMPAHRIVNSKGVLSGAKAFGHPNTQRMLLEAEGITVLPENRVDLERFGWKNTLEDALELQKLFEKEGV